MVDDNIVYSTEWEEYDYPTDTAECQFCGHYYCLCCGCDCWFIDDNYEEYEED